MAALYAELRPKAEVIHKAAGGPPVDPDPQWIRRIVDLVDEGAWAVMADATYRELLPVARRAIENSVGQLELADRQVIGRINTRAQREARERSANLVGKRWQNGHLVNNPNKAMAITEDTRARLKLTVERAFTEGLAPADLAEEIVDSYSFSEYRAALIAQTEIAGSQARANFASWEESGTVTGKGWQLSADHPEKPDECDENEAQGVIPLADEFASGDLHEPAHPNCFCITYAEALLPEMAGNEGDLEGATAD